MRLCVDEHYSPEIAAALRDRGHDVEAVSDRPDLAGLADAALWAAVIRDRRALVTENVSHFVPLARQTAATGDIHYGLILSSPRSMPRYPGTIGLFVDRLAEILGANPGDGALRDRVLWLRP